MDLEEREGVEPVTEERCEICGATLTQAEKEAMVRDGAAALCTVHAQEIVPIGEDADALAGDDDAV